MKKIIIPSLLLIFFVTLMLFLPQKIQAETLRLDVIKDAFINEAYPDTSFCNAPIIIVSTAPIGRYIFMQFEELNLPEEAVLENAIVHFYVDDHGYADSAYIRIGPNVFTGGWDECTPKWSGPYPGMYMTGDSFVDVNLDLSTGWKSVSIPNVVNMWLDNELEDAGIYFYTEDSHDFFAILDAKEGGINTSYLDIEYSIEEPEPEEDETPPDEATSDTDTDSDSETHESTEDGSEASSEEEQATSQQETDESSQKEKNTQKWLIAGLSGLMFIIFICLFIIIYFYKKESKKSAQKDKKTNVTPEQNEPRQLSKTL